MRGAIVLGMDDHNMRSAPDYKAACVVMFGVNLAWIFFAIWAIWGLLGAGALAWAVNRWLIWLERRRG
ncbi:MAG: hypothetical protein AAFY38_10695 [Pseudomonadota bacterium]